MCVPLPVDPKHATDDVDAVLLAGRLGMPLVADEQHRLWALGPETVPSGRALTTAIAPELVLPDLRTGAPFALSSLRGQKVLLLAWASW